jgi:hypothetical protein
MHHPPPKMVRSKNELEELKVFDEKVIGLPGWKSKNRTTLFYTHKYDILYI